MAQKKDIGVVRDAAADIIAVPTVTDIGVPTNLALTTADDMPQGTTHRRNDTDPDARQISDKGIGVPLNPQDGVTRD